MLKSSKSQGSSGDSCQMSFDDGSDVKPTCETKAIFMQRGQISLLKSQRKDKFVYFKKIKWNWVENFSGATIWSRGVKTRQRNKIDFGDRAHHVDTHHFSF